VASGSEVALAVAVSGKLHQQGIKVGVLSIACLNRFLQRGHAEQARLLPNTGFRFIMEAGSAQCWYQLLINYQGQSAILSVDAFGSSGCGMQVYEQQGFQVNAVCCRIMRLYNLSVADKHCLH
jgi:transketolase